MYLCRRNQKNISDMKIVILDGYTANPGVPQASRKPIWKSSWRHRMSSHCIVRPRQTTRYSVNRTPSSHLFEVVNVLFCQFIKFSTRLTFSHCRQSLGIWLIVERFMQKPLYQVVDTLMLPFCLGFQTL